MAKSEALSWLAVVGNLELLFLWDNATRLYGADEIAKLSRKPQHGKSRVWSLLQFEK
jgi:hypothetical protein